MAKIAGFKTHRPKDALDVGFTLDGYKLRWISGRQTEDKFGRIWQVLHKTDLPEELIKEMKKYHLDLFAHGDTIRKAELVLAFAPLERAMEHRKRLDAQNQDAMSRIQSNTGQNSQLLSVKKDNKVEKITLQDFEKQT